MPATFQARPLLYRQPAPEILLPVAYQWLSLTSILDPRLIPRQPIFQPKVQYH